MAETLCFFGLTTVRMGTRIVAYLQFWSQLFVAVLVISKYFYHWSDTDESTTGGGANNSSSDNQTSSYTGMNYYSELDFDDSIFSKLSSTVLIIYTSYYLKIATYTHNLMYLNFWMILNSLYFFTSIAFIIFASLRIGSFLIFTSGLIVVLIKGYELYIVYQFYTDELLSGTVNNNQNPPSNGDQSLPQNHTTVEIGTEVNSTINDQRPTLEVKNITNNTN
ncbi:unnamed protein product [Aphis gossypii]|uniref:Uncharacterized protein n=1 Tax=Aphis gossypii TaxID=80765 RepID=A0A9P0J2T8_APHGO|nr:unnamed protein product [Aphis gossypii]